MQTWLRGKRLIGGMPIAKLCDVFIDNRSDRTITEEFQDTAKNI